MARNRRTISLLNGPDDMRSISWWPMLTPLVAAAVADLQRRRIPNWLVLPFPAAGVIVKTAVQGMKGLGESMGGIAPAVAVTRMRCRLRGTGMGDLKPRAAVSGWFGPAQMDMALVATGIAGAFLQPDDCRISREMP